MLKIIHFGLEASMASIACAEVIRPESVVLVAQEGTEVSDLWMLEQTECRSLGIVWI